ncbi:MAG: hypothetical protein ACE5PV_27445 [Candidatus Poribacteria bacterium]
MARTISLNALSSDAEQMLRQVWDAKETVLIEHGGTAVAAVVPMEEYRQLHPEKTTPSPEEAIPYELPAELLTAYHRLLDKKFTIGLTTDEEKELAQIDKRLDEADMTTPLEQSIRTKARKEHQQRMAVLNDILAKLRALNNLP